jgi:hypothetical protein
MKLTTKRKLVLGAMFIALSVTTASAQIGPPDEPDDTGAAPIDALLGLGLAAGACLGIKKSIKK